MDKRGRLCETRCCMSVRAKIILVVLPLLVATLVLSSVASSLSARNGITRIAVEFLDFKAQDLRNYLDGQWGLLAANALAGQPQYVQAAQAAAAGYARSLQGSDSELIVAVGPSGQLELATRPGLESGAADLAALRQRGTEGWITFSLAGTRRVGYGFRFEPFDWYCLVSEERGAFYREVTEILGQNAIILLAACAASVARLLVFSGYLTRPVGRMVQAMQDIVRRHDLSGRVEVEYADEMGTRALTRVSHRRSYSSDTKLRHSRPETMPSERYVTLSKRFNGVSIQNASRPCRSPNASSPNVPRLARRISQTPRCPKCVHTPAARASAREARCPSGSRRRGSVARRCGR
mgnify:CR=1 FL=1